MPTTGPVPKNWLVYSYICSKDYELDLNFGEKKIKIKSYNYTKKKTNNFAWMLYSLQNNAI